MSEKSAGGGPQIRIELEGELGWLVLARPAARNAMTRTMGEEIQRAVSELRQSSDLRVIIVRGEGEAFSAGGDMSFIAERQADTAENNRAVMNEFYRLFLSILELPMPTIAALHGAAMGAGLCFALACDLRLAARGTRMGLNFVRLGLHPGMGATLLLPHIVGPARAAELLLTGRILDADAAERMGLVSLVCEPSDLLDRARALAQEIAAGAPLAVARTKATLRQGVREALSGALDREACAQALDYATADLAEGVRAFHERRPPRHQGR